MRRDIAHPAISSVFLRFALAATFADSVGDRLGLWGPPGSAHVAWGDFGHFEAHVRTLNWFLPAALIPALAWTVTILETGLTVALALGLWVRWTAIAGGTLLLLFALAMTAALGLKAPLDYSVYSASAGAFLLATVRRHAFALESLWRSPLTEHRTGTPSVQQEG